MNLQWLINTCVWCLTFDIETYPWATHVYHFPAIKGDTKTFNIVYYILIDIRIYYNNLWIGLNYLVDIVFMKDLKINLLTSFWCWHKHPEGGSVKSHFCEVTRKYGKFSNFCTTFHVISFENPSFWCWHKHPEGGSVKSHFFEITSKHGQFFNFCTTFHVISFENPLTSHHLNHILFDF